MTEITLESKQELTMEIKAKELYLIHNCKVVQNQSDSYLWIGEKELNSENRGLILMNSELYIAEEPTDVYILSHYSDITVWLRGGE